MRATNPIISDGANEKPGVVGRKHNCANCNIRVVCPVGRAFVPVINGGYAERIGLRCDLWGADE